jgi:hypothetical protein
MARASACKPMEMKTLRHVAGPFYREHAAQTFNAFRPLRENNVIGFIKFVIFLQLKLNGSILA